MNEVSPSLVKQAKKHLAPSQLALVDDAIMVLDTLKRNHVNDYSFLVAPVSKAYEGYLKDFFLKIGIIDNYSYQSDRFRVGKTLNPSLRYKRFSIYQKLADLSRSGEEMAEKLWTAWKYGRNEIFHFFPNKLKYLSREDATDRITMLLSAINDSGKFYQDYLNGTLL